MSLDCGLVTVGPSDGPKNGKASPSPDPAIQEKGDSGGAEG